METKKTNAEAAKISNAVKPPLKKVEDQKAPEISLTELQKQNEILIKKVQQLEALKKEPENLEERIKFFEEKKHKIEHLNLFKHKNGQLKEALSVIKPITENEEFTKKEYKLTLEVLNQYGRGENLFEVTNPLIIENCISYILHAIAQKIAKLENEIKS